MPRTVSHGFVRQPGPDSHGEAWQWMQKSRLNGNLHLGTHSGAKFEVVEAFKEPGGFRLVVTQRFPKAVAEFVPGTKKIQQQVRVAQRPRGLAVIDGAQLVVFDHRRQGDFLDPVRHLSFRGTIGSVSFARA